MVRYTATDVEILSGYSPAELSAMSFDEASALADRQREAVVSNWQKLGYEYWYTDYNQEHWRRGNDVVTIVQ